jgi:hypothetical protein
VLCAGLIVGVLAAGSARAATAAQAISPQQELSTPATTASAPLDISTIDPLLFKTMAARLPEGQAPKIDGQMGDAVWQLAPPAGHFIQREPHPGAPSSERTEFRVLYDDRKIYFGI